MTGETHTLRGIVEKATEEKYREKNQALNRILTQIGLPTHEFTIQYGYATHPQMEREIYLMDNGDLIQRTKTTSHQIHTPADIQLTDQPQIETPKI